MTENQKNNKPEQSNYKFIGYGITIGTAVGTLISVLTGDWASWIPVGIAIGAAIGSGYMRVKAQNKNQQKFHRI